jgi:hypothetical protein
VESGGNHLVSIAKEGFFPRTEGVSFREPRRLDLGVLVMTGGESISGIVMDASRGIPFAGAHVLGRNLQSGPFTHVTSDGLSWTKDHFELERYEATTGSDGRFSIEGLAQGAYLIDVSDPNKWCSLPGVTGAQFTVNAPASNATLEFSAPRILFNVLADGHPVPRARVQVRAPDSQPFACETSDDGSILFEVPAGVDLNVEVQKSGYIPQRFSMKAPQDAQALVEEIALLVGPPPGKLNIQLVALQDHPVLDVSMGFFTDQGEGASPVFTRYASSKDSTFEVGDIPAGRYRVVLHTSRDWNFFSESFYLPADLVIESRPGEVSRATVVLELGGRLMIRIRDSSGASLKAGAVLKDSSNRPLSVMFMQYDRDANMTYMGTWQPHVTAAHPEEFVSVQPALAEGKYSAELKLEGFTPRTETFQVTKGQVTKLDVTMEPKRP